MLYPRIIPCLLLHNKGLVKTVKFKDPKYVGDPINAVKIFNEKEVDELIVLDIDATSKNKEPDYKMIENLASECRMPLCYGGGIKTIAQAKRIFTLGVEKIAMSSTVIDTPEILMEIATQVGAQSLVVILDVKKRLLGSKYDIYTHNGRVKHSINLFDFVKELEKLRAGEIIINSIDNDGIMKGYDMDLIARVKSQLSIPMTALGGAGSLEDIKQIIMRHKIIGVAVGSFFVFKGKYRAVLINYPSYEDKENMIERSWN